MMSRGGEREKEKEEPEYKTNLYLAFKSAITNEMHAF